MKKHTIRQYLFKVLALVLTAVILLEIPCTYVRADETEIGFNYTSKKIYTGKSFKLVLNNAPAKIKWWASADESIATVSKKGEVTGVAPGTVKIKAKCNDVKYTCVVTVVDPYIKVEKNYFKVGTTMTATMKGAKLLNYVSNSPNIVSVDKDGTLTAKAKGTATITAYCKNGKNYSV